MFTNLLFIFPLVALFTAIFSSVFNKLSGTSFLGSRRRRKRIFSRLVVIVVFFSPLVPIVYPTSSINPFNQTLLFIAAVLLAIIFIHGFIELVVRTDKKSNGKKEQHNASELLALKKATSAAVTSGITLPELEPRAAEHQIPLREQQDDTTQEQHDTTQRTEVYSDENSDALLGFSDPAHKTETDEIAPELSNPGLSNPGLSNPGLSDPGQQHGDIAKLREELKAERQAHYKAKELAKSALTTVKLANTEKQKLMAEMNNQDSFNQEISLLRSDNNSLEERITALSSELQSERVEHELTRGQFKESQASAELVKSEIRQQQVKLDQLEPTQQALSTLRTDYFAVQEQLLERKKELEQECEEHVKTKVDKLEPVQQELSTLKSHYSAAQELLLTRKKEFEHAKTKLDTLEPTQRELAKLKSDYSAVQEQLLARKKELGHAKTKLDTLEPTQQELAKLKSDYSAAQEQLLIRKREFERERAEHAKTKLKSSDANTVREQLQAEIDGLHSKLKKQQLIEKEQQRIEIEQQRIERENVELNDKSVALQEQILTLDATLKAKNREHEKAKKVIEEVIAKEKLTNTEKLKLEIKLNNEKILNQDSDQLQTEIKRLREQIKDKDNKLGLEQEQHEKAQQQQLDIKATMESVNAEKEKLEARLVNLENQTQETTQLRSDNTQLQQRIATLKTRVKIEQKEHEGTKASVEDALLKAKLANEEKEQLMLQMGSLDYNDENIEGVRSDNANLQKLVLQQSVELEAERDELEEAKALAVDAIAIVKKARQAQKESDELAQSEKSQRIRVQEQYSKLALLLHNVKSASAIKVDSEFSKEVSELQINGDGQVIKNEAVGNIP